MVTLVLRNQEAGLLRQVLQSDVSDLSHEIADTDSMDFRERLKEKRVVLSELIERLRHVENAATN